MVNYSPLLLFLFFFFPAADSACEEVSCFATFPSGIFCSGAFGDVTLSEEEEREGVGVDGVALAGAVG